MEITGRTVLITGGTAGIGLGLARRLHALGNTVIVAGRRRPLLDEIVEAHPGMASVVLDVTDPASIRAAFDDVTTRFPALDVLFANAGIATPEDLRTGRGLAGAEDTVATNVLGTLRVSNLFVPWFVARGRGTVVTTGSGLAFVPLAGAPSYGASKAFVHSFTQALRVQLSGTGVDVVELVPPAVRTSFYGQQDDQRAVPLETFLDETFAVLRDEPHVEEVLVEAVKPLRFAEVNGNHAALVGLLAAH